MGRFNHPTPSDSTPSSCLCCIPTQSPALPFLSGLSPLRSPLLHNPGVHAGALGFNPMLLPKLDRREISRSRDRGNSYLTNSGSPSIRGSGSCLRLCRVVFACNTPTGGSRPTPAGAGQLRKKEHKSYFGKNRTHDFRTSRCAVYLVDHSGDECTVLFSSRCVSIARLPISLYCTGVIPVEERRHSPPPISLYWTGAILVEAGGHSPPPHFLVLYWCYSRRGARASLTCSPIVSQGHHTQLYTTIGPNLQNTEGKTRVHPHTTKPRPSLR